MKRAFLILALLVLPLNAAQAVFSQFVVITPENETEYGIEVRVSPLGDGTRRYILTVPVVRDFKQTWFVMSRSRLQGRNRNLRDFIWSGGKEGDPGIVAVTELHPDGKYPETAGSKIRYAEILLHEGVADRSYVYIDYPGTVFDGGFYFLVDLGAYLKALDDP